MNISKLNSKCTTSQLKRISDRMSSFVPFGKRECTCFFSLRPGPGGPATFSGKLANGFRNADISIIYRNLQTANSALIFSNSWGDWFYKICKRREIRTVLRVDGFMIPTYFDNRKTEFMQQSREMTLQYLSINHRLQRDILMSDFVVYQSKFSKMMADQFLYNRQDKYSIIYNGIDTDHFCPATINNRRLRLVIAGTLRDEYMLGSVLPIFKRLQKKHDLELLIVGSVDTICRAQISDFARENSEIYKRIKVIGSVENSMLPKYMQQADILVHPRLGDWCPNTVIEAMSCGLAVVCGSWGGAAEIVGNAGIVVPTGDDWNYGDDFINKLSDGVETILANLDYYKTCSRNRVLGNFGIEEISFKYIDNLMLYSK